MGWSEFTDQPFVYLDKTFVYEYNGIGNIETVTTTYSSGTPSTKTLTYGDTAHPDRLTSYNGKAITYDTMGCPTSYDGKNFMWYDGKLSSVSKGSGLGRAIISNRENYFYTYNAKGQRTHKNYSYLPVDLSATYYYTRSINAGYTYDNAGRLIKERRTYTYSDNTSYSIEFMFLYDESGIVGVQFKDGDAAAQAYYYQKNLQGDIIAIYDTAGAVQAKYSYDAWGNCTVTNSTNSHLANYNPIRYRGYYWDSETGWYFLNARYYSPEWRRFISPDNTAYLDPKNVNGLNLYVYCNNNPIMYVDPNGNNAILLTIFDWPRGLPIFGHTVLLIEVDGKWYSTEFESGAEYNIEWLSDLGIPSSINPKIYTSKYPINKDAFLANLKSYMMTEFTGDFSASLARAQDAGYHEENYNGNYNLIMNNCAHYVADVLLQSPDLGEHIRNYYEKKPIVPIFMHITTDFIQTYPNIFETLSSWWGSFTSYFMGG